jgi:hydrogenase maturation protease
MDLVVGVGTDRGDDAAGLTVVRRLRASGHPVTLAELAGDLTRLIDLWQPTDRVAVVDAVRSGAPAGTVQVLDAAAGPLPAGAVPAGSTHGLGLDTAIELARGLGRLPARLIVYGIEGSQWTDGTGLSPEVSAAVDRVVALLTQPHPTSTPGVSRSAGAAHR